MTTGTGNGGAAAGADIDFGTYQAQNNAGSITKRNTGGVSGGVQVKCSKSTPFSIGMASGNLSNNTGAGSMKSSSSSNLDTIPYQLYQPTLGSSGGTSPATSLVWGSDTTSGTSNVVQSTGQGMGTTLNFPVFATIAAHKFDKLPDSYSDQVTVTVNY
ncbi:MAG: spore coat protein U domain-containing protein [Brachymonas sp.]